MTPEEVYFEVMETYSEVSQDRCLRELIGTANIIKSYRQVFAKAIVPKLPMSHLNTLTPLLDDSVRSDLVKDQVVLSNLIYIGLVTVVAMGEEDYVTLTPMGRIVCISMMQKITRVVDRNTRLRRMLELVNLNSFSDYMEEKYNESVLELDYVVSSEQVVLKKITSDGNIKVNRLDLDPNRLLDIHTVKMFKDIETFLKLNSSS